MKIHFMDMKRHMVICFFISMLVDREKEWLVIKQKVVIKKGGKQSLRKLIVDGSSIYIYIYIYIYMKELGLKIR
jgi:hypothetical protein